VEFVVDRKGGKIMRMLIYIIVVLSISLSSISCCPTGKALDKAIADCEKDEKNGVILFSNLRERCQLCPAWENSMQKVNEHLWAFYLKQHPELSDSMKDNLWNGRLAVGMNLEQVIICWGNPYRINKSTGSFGLFDQFVYTPTYINHNNNWRYVYMKNGILVSWQD